MSFDDDEDLVPTSELAVVRVRRRFVIGFKALDRAGWVVAIDDDEVERLMIGERTQFHVWPGAHRMTVVGHRRSRRLRASVAFDASPGQVLDYACWPEGEAWARLLLQERKPPTATYGNPPTPT